MVGELAASQGNWSFSYAAAWLAASGRFPLSPTFPLEDHEFADTSERRPVQWFFDNLLPEGGVREALARFAELDARDSFGLLARYGAESAGALTLLPVDVSFPATGAYAPLAAEEISVLIERLPRVPLIAAGGRLKMSLAGAQHKLPVHWDGNQLYLAEGAAPSTWILKPEHARPEDYPMTPANEHYCMALAGAMGLPVPEIALLHLPMPLYLCRRYDRHALPEGARRLHQIDFLQLANKWPSYKYEVEGGATLREVFDALALTRQPAVTKNQVLRWVVFNYLIGNSDAHAKNLSFLIGPAGITPAPCYDLLCVKVYGDEHMAMSLGGESRYAWVTGREWDALAREAGVLPSLLKRIRLEFARKIVPLAERLRGDPAYTDAEREFLGSIVTVVREHGRFVLEGADVAE